MLQTVLEHCLGLCLRRWRFYVNKPLLNIGVQAVHLSVSSGIAKTVLCMSSGNEGNWALLYQMFEL